MTISYFSEIQILLFYFLRNVMEHFISANFSMMLRAAEICEAEITSFLIIFDISLITRTCNFSVPLIHCTLEILL